MSSTSVDVVVIGAGLVGLATAYRILEAAPGTRLIVVEKEDEVARHQSSRNSGVIHSGIYYKPGSRKSENCRAGRKALMEFCEEECIPFRQCGQVIVATDENERSVLREIYAKGQANGVECEIIGQRRLREIEPYAAGIEAIHIPGTGIVEYAEVARILALRIRELGAVIHAGTRVTGISTAGTDTVVETTRAPIRARVLVNCAGLYSDRIAAMTGQKLDVKIVPFRGEYYRLRPEAESLCRTLIYPVPNPNFPFLGVHFTSTIDGGVECGPNAVLAFAREGYEMTDINPRDLLETVCFSGFRKLALRYWRTGIGELWRSVSKAAFVRSLQRLVPDVREEHLIRAPAGVRAQAVTRDGELHSDFVLTQSGAIVNVCNAPSPAATSALSIGQTIAARIRPRLGARPTSVRASG
jgi:L-2-hydroxyglutarate oxidase LhgO